MMVENIVTVIAIFSLGVGSLGVLFGALGLLRLGDVYQRMHGAGIIDTGGAGLILFGLLLASPDWTVSCLLYTSPSPRDRTRSRMPSSA